MSSTTPGGSPVAAAQLDNLLRAVATAGRPPSRSLPLPAGRENFLELMRPLAADEHVAVVEDRVIPATRGEVRLRTYRNSGQQLRPATVFFHGGGWVFGGLDSHDRLCRALARESDTVVVAVDYGLSPEHRFPEPLEDCFSATRWVAEHGQELGADPRRMAVAGDSAGANLATAVAMRARDEGSPAIGFQLLAYPALIPEPSGPAGATSACDPFLTREEMDWFWSSYLGDRSVELSAYAAPGTAVELAGMPPACLVVAEIDPLRDEAIDYAKRMQEAGVPVELRLYQGMVHGFLLFTNFLEDGRRALRDAGLSLGRAMNPASPSRPAGASR